MRQESRQPADAAGQAAGLAQAPQAAWRYRRSAGEPYRTKHLQRDLKADAPNQKWVADFTYNWMAEGCLYAAGKVPGFAAQRHGRGDGSTSEAAVADASH